MMPLTPSLHKVVDFTIFQVHMLQFIDRGGNELFLAVWLFRKLPTWCSLLYATECVVVSDISSIAVYLHLGATNVQLQTGQGLVDGQLAGPICIIISQNRSEVVQPCSLAMSLIGFVGTQPECSEDNIRMAK